VKVLDTTRFTVTTPIFGNDFDNPLVLPLTAAPVTRSGGVTIKYNTWQMNYTDSGNGSTLSQTPLNSPTVFNFYYPDYKYQGILASAGLTTPEFQLTSDTSVALQLNFLERHFQQRQQHKWAQQLHRRQRGDDARSRFLDDGGEHVRRRNSRTRGLAQRSALRGSIDAGGEDHHRQLRRQHQPFPLHHPDLRADARSRPGRGASDRRIP
jgi:hypothetical protein